MSLICIAGGTIVDPANRSQAFAGDLWLENGRVVAPDGRRAELTIQASGRIVMAGGVDMHSHFAGPAINAVRMLTARMKIDNCRQDSEQTGVDESPFVPDITTTGLRYAGLGYTTAIDAAIPFAHARRAAREMAHMPVVDGGFLLLVGNEPQLMNWIEQGEQPLIGEFVRQRVAASGASGIKLVSPGAVNDWKRGYRDPLNDIDQPLQSARTTPRAIIEALAGACDAAALAHPLHLHCNHLGMPGNWRTTLATMRAIGDRRAHLAHIQFHSYRGGEDGESFSSAAEPLAAYVNAHPNLSVDVGQVMFGSTVTMTADSPLAWYLHRISGKPWISHDVAGSGGCGIVPIRYRRRDRIHALQWAIGLEWMLLMEDPWRIALTTDHPNGASFLVYPQIMALLMDAGLRRQHIARVHASLPQQSILPELDRQYSLEEIAIVTRAAPARLLGLSDRGHLGPGAIADVVIYEPDDDKRKMFEFPRTVIKSGKIVVDDGDLRDETALAGGRPLVAVS